MKLFSVLGMLGFSAMAVAGPLELERELNNLNVDIEVSELETNTGQRSVRKTCTRTSTSTPDLSRVADRCYSIRS